MLAVAPPYMSPLWHWNVAGFAATARRSLCYNAQMIGTPRAAAAAAAM